MNSRAWMIGLLVILAVVCAAALALVNVVTAPMIAKQSEVRYKQTVLDVFGIPYDQAEPDSIIALYDRSVVEEERDGLTLFTEETGKKAFSIDGSGFQGTISVIVALEGDVISGLKVVSQVETPGLGARITEATFQAQFVGKQVRQGIRMTRLGAAGPSEFDAITGATETSRALERILNQGFERFFAVMEQ